MTISPLTPHSWDCNSATNKTSDAACSCGSSSLKPPTEQWPEVGSLVEKTGGDYTFRGEVVAVFNKKSGVVRYVVENDDGMLFIFNAGQLKPPRTPSEVKPAESVTGTDIAKIVYGVMPNDHGDGPVPWHMLFDEGAERLLCTDIAEAILERFTVVKK